MALSIGEIEVQLSGGAANTDPDLSLGGAISTAAAGANRVISQTAAAPTNVTGVSIINAFGNAEGNGELTWDQPTSYLYWRPFGAISSIGFNITADGIYSIGDTNGFIVVDVTFASLPGTSEVDSDITIANATENAFDNVSALESLNGDVEYRCFYLKNTNGADTAFDVRIWVKSQPSGPDELDIALDTGGKNITAIGPLSNEEDGTSLLTGLSWSRPSTQATGLTLGNLTTGDYYAFWIRRTVAAETTQKEPNDISSIGYSALV